MPPKVKITKEDIINAAFELVRTNGEENLNARNIAASLNCSTQPIFSNFENMQLIRMAVIKKAEDLCEEYIQREVSNGKYPRYKASGMAYIRFANEEKELFKLLYMRDRTKEEIPEETDLGNEMEGIVYQNTGLDKQNAKLFHLQMWAFVHGIASMLATGYLSLSEDLISTMLTNMYEGMKKQYERK